MNTNFVSFFFIDYFRLLGFAGSQMAKSQNFFLLHCIRSLLVIHSEAYQIMCIFIISIMFKY